jgi:hypothetical protein
MKRGKTRPFTAPRPSKPVQTGHRKENAEWGKSMERLLAQIEKKQASVETHEKTTSDEDDVPIALTIAHTNEIEKYVQSGSDDDDIPFSQLRDKVREETPGSLTDKERPRQVEDNMIRSLSETLQNDSRRQFH